MPPPPRVRSRVAAGAVVAAATLVLPPAADAQETFSVADVMSAPFPSELTAAPEGGRVAWVLYEQGVRNVYAAAPTEYRARRLTDYAEDDGQAIDDLGFTGDGDRLVYARGGGPNRAGMSPNPAQVPAGTERAVWSVRAGKENGAPVRLSEGHSPTPSPEGDRVAFVRDGDLWLVPADGEADPERAVREKGTVEEIRWSPSGDRIAFVVDRGEHAFVAVYDPAGEEITYLDPGLSEDRSPAWSPDGSRVAFLRLHPDSDPPYSTDRTGPGWEVRVADAETGAGRLVWSAPEGRGSAFRPLATERQLFWSAGEHLVFPWEREGWRHLYSLPVQGGEPVQLTPGRGMVEHAALSADRGSVVYSSNIGDVDRRHVWRVPARGGEPRQLTSGDGIEWSPAETSAGEALVFLASDARRPGHARISVGGREPRALAPERLPDRFPADRLVEPEPVTLSGADGKRVRGQLFLPPEAEAGDGRPAVLFLHGGSRRQMLLGWHYMRYYHNSYAMNQYLAGRGYVVLSLNYRSGIGYGLEFREARRWGARGASELNDVLGAGLYLRSRPEVDGDRIGLYGGSYGGYLTALGLARASDLFAAGADFHGVHDWNIEFEFDRVELPYQVDSLESVQQLAWRSSPMAWTETWRSPVLFVHGDDDRTVPFRESVRLAERLRERGVPFEEFVIPGEVHDFLLHGHWVAAYERTAEFFAAELGDPGGG